ncbi:MAG TPA: GntR family transcriptional regulator [Verrucomicrobiae bacterium]|nr:GntR family transcriptional regulator [Verrucomicrobiae bacterium]
MPAVLTVDPRSGVPIYLQIIEQIKRSVALGVLQTGEQLPTVKQLALDLTINPNTVAKAYRDLEREQVIETFAGRGSFVRNGGVSEAKTAISDVAAKAFETAVRDARALGLSKEDVRDLIERSVERWFPEER